MISKTIRVVALSGILALGAGGVALSSAGASSSNTGSSSNSVIHKSHNSHKLHKAHKAHKLNCTKANSKLARLTKVETKASGSLSKLESREQAARSGGKVRSAVAIQLRIDRIELLQARVDATTVYLKKLCPAGGSSGVAAGGTTTT